MSISHCPFPSALYLPFPSTMGTHIQRTFALALPRFSEKMRCMSSSYTQTVARALLPCFRGTDKTVDLMRCGLWRTNTELPFGVAALSVLGETSDSQKQLGAQAVCARAGQTHLTLGRTHGSNQAGMVLFLHLHLLTSVFLSIMIGEGEPPHNCVYLEPSGSNKPAVASVYHKHCEDSRVNRHRRQ